MAHYFIKPDKDATLIRGASIEGTSSKFNLGGDEILEVGKAFDAGSTSVGSIQRALIKFPLTQVSKSVANGEIGSDVKFYLNLYDAGSFELTRDDNSLEVYVISQSWTEGDGKLTDSPHIQEGVSWRYRTGVTQSLEWKSGSTSDWGATYFSSSFYSASFMFSKTGSDARIDVTQMVNTLISGSASNEGFLLRRPKSIEALGNSNNYGVLKFFSSDTHTIYYPRLEAVWDDASWSTGSLSSTDLDELGKLEVYLTSLRQQYKLGSVSKIRVYGRERYVARSFATSSEYLTVKYFPSASSFYSITDSKTDHVLIPFGSGSKLSCDSTSNFFKLKTDGLEPERYYNIHFKVVSGSGINKTVEYLDNKHSFKIVE